MTSGAGRSRKSERSGILRSAFRFLRSDFGRWVLLVVLFGVLVAAVAADWTSARRVLHAADWRLLAPALAVTALSYVCSSTAYAQTCRAFGLAVKTARLLLAGFVTMAVNNLITLGGAGYAVGAVLLTAKDVTGGGLPRLSAEENRGCTHSERGLPRLSAEENRGCTHSGGLSPLSQDRVPGRLSAIAAASAFNLYLYFAVGTTCLPLSLLYVLADRRLPQRAAVGIGLVVALACLLAVVVNLAVFLPRFRKSRLRFLGRVIRFLSRRDISGRLDSFDDSFTRGLSLLRGRPGRLFGLLAAIIGDWLFCVAAIWFCFAALGIRLQAGVMLSGFFIAIAAGALSMLPGGLGVQDGSMAGVYALLGVPFGPALLAAVLFRVVYYIVPFAFGLAVYGRLLRASSRSTSRD